MIKPLQGSPDPEALARANARVRKFVRAYSTRGPYTLYPEPEVTENVIVGLAHNLAAHGKMYCPCADVESSKTRGHEMVCPCSPHHADIERQGYCDCALFASHEFAGNSAGCGDAHATSSPTSEKEPHEPSEDK